MVWDVCCISFRLFASIKGGVHVCKDTTFLSFPVDCEGSFRRFNTSIGGLIFSTLSTHYKKVISNTSDSQIPAGAAPPAHTWSPSLRT